MDTVTHVRVHYYGKEQLDVEYLSPGDRGEELLEDAQRDHPDASEYTVTITTTERYFPRR